METKTDQNRIVIKTIPKNEKQKFPVNLLFSLAAGAVSGVAFIFAVFWGAEKLLGL